MKETSKSGHGGHRSVPILAEAAVMLALASILSMIPILKMPLGGSVTLVSMLPILTMTIRRGAKWGFAVSFTYAAIQIFFDLSSLAAWGLTPIVFVGSLVFDYLLAFGILGTAGMPVFRKHGTAGCLIGITAAILLRFICHFISGIILFPCFDIYGSPAVWSLVYNGTFMLPELCFTLLISGMLMGFSSVRRKIFFIG